MLLGLLVFSGWVLGAAPLITPLGGQVAVRPNTALLLVMAGLAVTLAGSPWGARLRGPVAALAIAVVLVGAVTVLEYSTRPLPWFDDPFGLVPPGPDPLAPRPAWATGLAFVLVAGALLGFQHGTGRGRLVAEGALAAGATIAGYFVVAGWYGVSVSDPLLRMTPPMAVETALGLLAISAGVFASAKDVRLLAILGGDSGAAIAGRRFLVPVAGVPLILGWIEVVAERNALMGGAAGTALIAVLGSLLLSTAVVLGVRHARVLETGALRLEGQYRAAVEASPAGMLVVDAEGRVMLANRRIAEMFGYAHDELVGQPVEVLVPERFRTEHVGHRRRFVEGREHRMIEGRQVVALRKDGTEFPAELGLSTLQSGGPPTVLAAIVDITDRSQAEAALRESEGRFHLIATHIREAFFMHDLATGRALFLSQTWADIWGRSVAEGYANPSLWFEGIHPEDRPLMSADLEAGRRGEPTDRTFRVVRPGGEVRWVRGRSFPVPNEAGAITLLVGVAEDVTEQRSMESQLLQAQKMEAVGRLAGGVAHDFNNILTAIMGHLDFLGEQIPRGAPAEEDVAGIREAATRAAGLTRQLLAFSRKQVLQPGVFRLSEVVTRTALMLRRIIGEDIELITSLDPDTGFVEADPGQMEQVLLNLVVNARDAMPNGGRLVVSTGSVELDAARAGTHGEVTPGRYVMLSVADTGVGMDRETQARLFEPFFTTKEVGKGTGLGLASVYGIVKQSGGHVWVYSEPGTGSVFKVHLPEVRAANAVAPAADLPPVRGGTETVLVVEDDGAVRAVAVAGLTRLGYRVHDAAQGDEALGILRTGRTDLLVTDVIMPGMNGLDLAHVARTLQPGLRVLFASGYTPGSVALNAVVESGAAFLPKPYALDALARKVRELLDAPPASLPDA